MNEKEKIALGAVIAFTVVQAIRLHTFKNKVRGFVGATNAWIQMEYQERVDNDFAQIVTDFDKD